MRSLSPKIYDEKYFLTLCEGFDEFLSGGVSKRLQRAFSLADLRPKQKVLDLGAGRGELTIECAKRGCYVWGIDYSQAAIKIAKESLKKNHPGTYAKNVKFKLMDAKKLNFSDNFFDRVFMIDIIEHLYPEELKKVLREVKRVIKPGGKLVIYTPNAFMIKPVYLIAGILFGWKKQRYHVEEQSYFSLKRNLNIFKGKTVIFFEQNKNYFYKAISTSSLPLWVKKMAKFVDFLRDSRFTSLIIYQTPLAIFLGAKMWACVDLPREKER